MPHSQLQLTDGVLRNTVGVVDRSEPRVRRDDDPEDHRVREADRWEAAQCQGTAELRGVSLWAVDGEWCQD